MIKKIKRSKYEKDIIFLRLYNSIENINLDEKEEIPTFVLFVENKKDIDNSTLYSFNGPFQLLHADIVDILFFSKKDLFYEEVNHKRKEKMRLQTDFEFQQNEIKKLNKKYNVEMFSTRVKGGKAFAAEQKIREFKKLLLKIKLLYKKNELNRMSS